MDGGSTRAAVGETSKNLIATTMQNNRIGDGSVEGKEKKRRENIRKDRNSGGAGFFLLHGILATAAARDSVKDRRW